MERSEAHRKYQQLNDRLYEVNTNRPCEKWSAAGFVEYTLSDEANYTQEDAVAKFRWLANRYARTSQKTPKLRSLRKQAALFAQAVVDLGGNVNEVG